MPKRTAADPAACGDACDVPVKVDRPPLIPSEVIKTLQQVANTAASLELMFRRS